MYLILSYLNLIVAGIWTVKLALRVSQEDLRKAIMASIQEVDPGNPWIKDASGRHTNVMALLEWPMEDSDDSDTEVSIAALREYGKGSFHPHPHSSGQWLCFCCGGADVFFFDIP